MWIPKSEKEIVGAVTTEALEETVAFDAKAELPSKNKNIELAKDVAAMATDGGVLLYGVAEDENGRPTVLNPIPLAGQRERISAIVQTSIAEPPFVRISEIPTHDDPEVGYIVVVVPPSERAPHMVVVKGDNRFYGRTDTGNRMLPEAEVARLYERRQWALVDMKAMLSEAIAEYPQVDELVYMSFVARPVLSNESLLNRAIGEHDNYESSHTTELSQLMSDVIQKTNTTRSFYRPDFRLQSSWLLQPSGYLVAMSDFVRYDASVFEKMRETLELRVGYDGAFSLFSGRVGEVMGDERRIVAAAIAGLTMRSLVFVGTLYDKASYEGNVEVGILITRLRDGIPYDGVMPRTIRPLKMDEYYQSKSVSALAILENPNQITRDLVGPLFRTLYQSNYYPLLS